MEIFKKNLFTLTGMTLNPSQQKAFSVFERELLDWNTRFNLTAIRNSGDIHVKHFLDSLSCLLVIDNKTSFRMVDVGTGAGFPGIPLKIMIPEMRLTLVESVGKKADFCRHVVEVLSLPYVDVIQARAEDLGQMPEYREQFDFSIGRAVADLPVLVEYLLPLTRLGGAMIAQKGQHGLFEVQKAERAIQLLGGKVKLVKKVNLPGVVEDRFLIVIDKVAATHSRYPRRAGIAIKKPL